MNGIRAKCTATLLQGFFNQQWHYQGGQRREGFVCSCRCNGESQEGFESQSVPFRQFREISLPTTPRKHFAKERRSLFWESRSYWQQQRNATQSKVFTVEFFSRGGDPTVRRDSPPLLVKFWQEVGHSIQFWWSWAAPVQDFLGSRAGRVRKKRLDLCFPATKLANM